MLEPLLQDKEDIFNVVTIISALLAVPALLLFVVRPDLFERLDTLHLLLLLPGIGFSFVIVSGFAAALVRDGILRRANRVRQRDGEPPKPIEKQKDWQVLGFAAGYADIFLVLLTVWAYWHPLRLGASLIAWSLILVSGSLLLSILIQIWPLDWTNPRRGTNR